MIIQPIIFVLIGLDGCRDLHVDIFADVPNDELYLEGEKKDEKNILETGERIHFGGNDDRSTRDHGHLARCFAQCHKT